MTGAGDDPRPRAVVCGSRFGRVYMDALSRPDAPYRLAGVVGRGSARTRACARYWDVPLHTDPDEVPDDVEAACVVVGSALNGGEGTVLARRFLERGVHVLQEHPLHPDELAGCLRAARRGGAVHHVDTLFVHVAPVRRFLAAAAVLAERRPILFVEVTCAYQVLQTVLDILAEMLGGLHPSDMAAAPADAGPYRLLAGTVAGVPVGLRVQHEMDPREPDNHAHLLHRITVGVDGGHLTLVTSHGPVLWSVRAHMPPDLADSPSLGASAAPHLDVPSAVPIGPPGAPPYRTVLTSLWPEAIGRAARELRAAAAAGGDARHGQRQLGLSRLGAELSALLGPVRLVRRSAPEPVDVGGLVAAAEGAR